MCSSKIIRKGAEGQLPFTLVPIGSMVNAPAGDEEFRPIQLGGGDEAVALEAEPELPPEPASIPEEEALERIREAYAEGLREGKEQAESELATVGEALAQALLATGALRSQILHDAEDDLLKLSVLIARKVMLREFACEPGIMAGIVRSSVELASDGGSVTVRLNPEEYTVVAGTPEFEALLREHPNIAMKPDPSVGRAGCLVETARGNIDAGVDAQLDEILRRLTEEKSERREDLSDD
jgi:flagellar assembly protein FliH